MAKLLSAVQMSAVEGAAISSGHVTGLALMERAGQGVVEAILATWPQWVAGSEGKPGKAVVLCGPGNNGGDGFVIARLLLGRGWRVKAILLGAAGKLPPDARANYDRWSALGATEPLTERSLSAGDTPPDLVVDALFGTGLTRGIEGASADVLGAVAMLRRDFGAKCVAVDIPSGICADSGRPLGCFAPADLTVTFHSEKLGHYLEGDSSRCGRVVVVDIGLPQECACSVGAKHVRKVARPDPDLLGKATGGQKFDWGHALIMSGGAGHTGAARLAARGALRVGAGLVTLAVPKPAMSEVASQITALMMVQISGVDALQDLLQDKRLNALCIGPGLGSDAAARALVEGVLAAGRAVVLDADALSMFRDAPDALFAQLYDKCILTPHGGEFSRLFPDIAARLHEAPAGGPAYSRVDATRAAAQRAGCTVLFKGADTVIAAPDGSCAVHCALYDRAAPWLATAGSGDVLAGFITGLLARGVPPMQAAETAAWLHGECALTFGPGLISEDIPEQVPRVLRDMGL